MIFGETCFRFQRVEKVSAGVRMPFRILCDIIILSQAIYRHLIGDLPTKFPTEFTEAYKHYTFGSSLIFFDSRLLHDNKKSGIATFFERILAVPPFLLPCFISHNNKKLALKI